LVPHSPLRPRGFPRGKRCLPATVPCPLSQTGSSSRTLHASSEYCRTKPAPRLPTWSTFHGVARIPLRDINFWRPYHRVPPRQPCRPRRFSRPRRFAPPKALWVYFTPQPRPGFTLQGLPLARSRAASSASRALSSVSDSPLLAVAHQRHVLSPRPQGFDPHPSPLSMQRGLVATLTRYPLELCLLQVFLLNTVGAS